MIRAYQSNCVDAIQGEFDKGTQSTLAVLATALGKTVIASELIRRVQPARCVFLANRDTLIYQARDTIEKWAGVTCGIEMAELKADPGLFSKDQVVISTIQTQNSGARDAERMTRFKPGDFEYCFCDEAHNFTSPSFRRVIDHYRKNPRMKVIGLTATPDRHDRESLGQIFQTTAFQYDIEDGVDDGWLVPPEQHYVPVEGLDYSHIKTTAGDLNLGQLSDVMEEEETVQRMIQPTLEAAFGLEPHRLDYAHVNDWGLVLARHGTPKCTLVFCTSVLQAQRFAEVMNRVRSGMATAIWDKVSKHERRNIFKDFREGKLQCLVNVGICGEGFDAPGIELIVMGRATKSRRLYTQFVGRALRPLKEITDRLNAAAAEEERRQIIAQSAKASARIMDFVGNSGKHKLVTLADILGGRVSGKAVEKAKAKALKADRPVRIGDLLEESEEQVKKRIERQKKLVEERRLKLVARAKYDTIVVNPFDALDIIPAQPKSFDIGEKLSDKQQSLMRRFGIDPAPLSYTQAKQVFIELCNRMNKRMSTPAQIDLLKRHGYEDAKALPYKEAKRLIDNLRNNNWQRPPTKVEAL